MMPSNIMLLPHNRTCLHLGKNCYSQIKICGVRQNEIGQIYCTPHFHIVTSQFNKAMGNVVLVTDSFDTVHHTMASSEVALLGDLIFHVTRGSSNPNNHPLGSFPF